MRGVALSVALNSFPSTVIASLERRKEVARHPDAFAGAPLETRKPIGKHIREGELVAVAP